MTDINRFVASAVKFVQAARKLQQQQRAFELYARAYAVIVAEEGHVPNELHLRDLALGALRAEVVFSKTNAEIYAKENEPCDPS